MLFNHESYQYKAGNFQLMTCTKDVSGQIITALGASHFVADMNVTRFLFWQFDSSKIQLYQSAQTCTLDKEVYAKFRSQIKQKLGIKAQRFVKGLDI